MAVLVNCCVVVADAAGARLFQAERDAVGKVKLLQTAVLQNRNDPAHVESKARFANEIAQQIAAVVTEWRSGSVFVAAEPDLLSLLRQVTQAALPAGVTLRSLARDHVGLPPEELARRLDLG
jgi:protein required for attachment to host cells